MASAAKKGPVRAEPIPATVTPPGGGNGRQDAPGAARIETRRCRECGLDLPLDAYYQRDGKPTRRTCKSCTSRKVMAGTDKALERERHARYRRAPLARARQLARERVRDALEAGRMTKPVACQRCKASGVRITAHHEDYCKPLEVEWMCDVCHKARHAEVKVVGLKCVPRRRRGRPPLVDQMKLI